MKTNAAKFIALFLSFTVLSFVGILAANTGPGQPASPLQTVSKGPGANPLLLPLKTAAPLSSSPFAQRGKAPSKTSIDSLVFDTPILIDFDIHPVTCYEILTHTLVSNYWAEWGVVIDAKTMNLSSCVGAYTGRPTDHPHVDDCIPVSEPNFLKTCDGVTDVSSDAGTIAFIFQDPDTGYPLTASYASVWILDEEEPGGGGQGPENPDGSRVEAYDLDGNLLELVWVPNGPNGSQFFAEISHPGIHKVVAVIGQPEPDGDSGALDNFTFTLEYPDPDIEVETFYTDTEGQPLPQDPDTGMDLILAVIKRTTDDLGTVISTNPGGMMAWVDVVNVGIVPIQSLSMFDILPVDWDIEPPWIPGLSGIQAYYVDAGGTVVSQIDPANLIVESIPGVPAAPPGTGDPGTVAVDILNLNTAMGKALEYGERIRFRLKMRYSLIDTIQSEFSYPVTYTDYGEGWCFEETDLTGNSDYGNAEASFLTKAKMIGSPQ